MEKRALLVGIDHYDHMPHLTGCVADARAMRSLLRQDFGGETNYDCRLMTGDGQGPRVTRQVLRGWWHSLFNDLEEHLLFYFSGHGTPTRSEGFLCTQDGTPDEPGLPMDELLTLANRSRAKSVLLILDCCYSGHLGDPYILQKTGEPPGQALLREGVTLLAASRSSERARESDGHGLFTKLILGALNGGAADVRGRVSAASIYAYAEQALGWWDQRPMYKSNANRLPPVRRCRPTVTDALLSELPAFFATEDSRFRMDPTFERTEASARAENVEIFNKFKRYRNAGLLATEDDVDLYYAATESRWVHLTPLGQLYWMLAKKGQLHP